MVIRNNTVLIMAGGTGGHVFPALAVAEDLRQHGVEVQWLGTRAGIEARVVPAAGFSIQFINVKGLRGKGVLRWIIAPVRLLRALIETIKIFLQIRPQVILGMGGFVTGPGGLTAWLLRRPLVVHEQNAIPGLTNKILFIFAKRVLQAFPNSFKHHQKVLTTGNPVRKAITYVSSPEKRLKLRSGPIRILVLGGSLGAQVLNECVPKAIAKLSSADRPDILHQAGNNKHEYATRLYKDNGINANVVTFIEDMAEAYTWADLVICRAGAMTIAEISNVGLASILVPYPFAVDDHQTVNARFLCDADAAVLIKQVELTPERLSQELGKLIDAGRDQLLHMAKLARKLAEPHATEIVAKHCLEVMSD